MPIINTQAIQKPSPQSKIQTQIITKPAVKTQTALKTATQLQTELQTETVTQPVTEPETIIPPETPIEEPPRPNIIIKLDISTDEGKKRAAVARSDAAVTYRRGELSHLGDIWHTWAYKDGVWTRYIIKGAGPKGAIVIKGARSAYETIQKLGSAPLPESGLREDTGINETVITTRKGKDKQGLDIAFLARKIKEGTPIRIVGNKGGKVSQGTRIVSSNSVILGDKGRNKVAGRMSRAKIVDMGADVIKEDGKTHIRIV